MRKILASSVVVLMVLFLSAGFGLAKGPGSGGGTGGGDGICDGTGGGSTGPGGGTGIPIHVISDGEPFLYSGDVSEFVEGGGIVIATTEYGDQTIYGIGSVRYWDSLGVDRPGVTDTIDVEGYNVEYSEGVFRNIATIITVGGVEVPLRDSDGVPLWRGGNGNNN
jgi:hypothetical protein